MKLVEYQVNLHNDTIQIPLDEPYSCYVGLVEIALNNFNTRGFAQNAMRIKCYQIDSTFDNPNRILRTISLNRTSENLHIWRTNFIKFEKVDSQDKFLTLKINRISGQNLVFHNADHRVWLTLAFSTEKSSNWLNHTTC